MSEPSSELVQAFWVYMAEAFDSQTVHKGNAAEMRVVADFLHKLGILEKRAFLDRFATTLGRRIYIPFQIGIESPGRTLWGQMLTCVHEHQHVAQARKDGLAEFALNYATSSAKRSRYEADAYRTHMELEMWRFGEIRADATQLAQKLDSYAVKPLDIGVAEKILSLSAESIRRGAVVTRASKVAITWLDQYASDLTDHVRPTSER